MTSRTRTSTRVVAASDHGQDVHAARSGRRRASPIAISAQTAGTASSGRPLTSSAALVAGVDPRGGRRSAASTPATACRSRSPPGTCRPRTGRWRRRSSSRARRARGRATAARASSRRARRRRTRRRAGGRRRAGTRGSSRPRSASPRCVRRTTSTRTAAPKRRGRDGCREPVQPERARDGPRAPADEEHDADVGERIEREPPGVGERRVLLGCDAIV